MPACNNTCPDATLADATLSIHMARQVKLDGCVDPFVIAAVNVLTISLSDEVIIGAIAIRRSASVLLTLLPAALGLALGAGQGSTLSKTVLPSSRQPARLSSIIVTLSMLFIAALLASINQLLASGWATLGCFSIICALGMWLPVGLIPKGMAVSTSIINPAPAKAVIDAIGKRKYGVSFFTILALVFVACFIGFSNAVSMMTEQLEEAAASFSNALRMSQNRGAFGPLFLIIFPVVQTILEVTAKTCERLHTHARAALTRLPLSLSRPHPLQPHLPQPRPPQPHLPQPSHILTSHPVTSYPVTTHHRPTHHRPSRRCPSRRCPISDLAQAFYTDAATVAITLMWHNDRADDPETAKARSEELAEVAQALNRDELQRQMTYVPRSRKEPAKLQNEVTAPVNTSL